VGEPYENDDASVLSVNNGQFVHDYFKGKSLSEISGETLKQFDGTSGATETRTGIYVAIVAGLSLIDEVKVEMAKMDELLIAEGA
jgi:hypothetical protein